MSTIMGVPRFVRTDGVGAGAGDHVPAAENDGVVPIQRQRRRPDIQANHPVCVPRGGCLRDSQDGQRDEKSFVRSMGKLPSK